MRIHVRNHGERAHFREEVAVARQNRVLGNEAVGRRRRITDVVEATSPHDSGAGWVRITGVASLAPSLAPAGGSVICACVTLPLLSFGLTGLVGEPLAVPTGAPGPGSGAVGSGGIAVNGP